MVANLNIDEAHDNTPDVVLRGVGSFGLVAGVGFYVNDVQVFEGQIARPIDIERIEVLKGPVGTLFGGANVGGAIKYVTKEPTSTWENEASVELGSFSTRNYQAVVSGPISDTVGVRASVYYDSHDGNVYDTVNKFDYGAANDHGARVTVVAAPNESNKIHLCSPRTTTIRVRRTSCTSRPTRIRIHARCRIGSSHPLSGTSAPSPSSWTIRWRRISR